MSIPKLFRSIHFVLRHPPWQGIAQPDTFLVREGHGVRGILQFEAEVQKAGPRALRPEKMVKKSVMTFRC